MLILGIETSCDDTAMAILEARGGMKRPRFRILSNVVSSQVKTHAPYGGVVPTLAAREHTKNFVPVLRKTLRQASRKLYALSHKQDKEKAYGLRPTAYGLLREVDLIAVTNTPGLLPALLIGVTGARTLAWALKKPILGINHLEGHIAANWLRPIRGSSKSPPASASSAGEWRAGETLNPKPYPLTPIPFPAICLIVSGGHTQLVLMRGHLNFKVIGETRDDAAGEAFDKVAKLLGLPFPGGPPIAAQAAKWQLLGHKPYALSRKQNKNGLRHTAYGIRQICLPRPMINSKDYDFSFSGLKTAVLYAVKDVLNVKDVKDVERAMKNNLNIPALCAEFQQAVIDVLVAKTIRAAKQYRAKSVILGGGVAANTELRKQLREALQKLNPSPYPLFPNPSLAVDNGAMIAAAAYFRWLSGERKTWRDIYARV